MPKLPQDTSSYLEDRRDADQTAGAAMAALMTGRRSLRSDNPPRKRGPLKNQGTTPGGTEGLRLDAFTNAADIDARMMGFSGGATPSPGGSLQRVTTDTSPPELSRGRLGQPGFTSQLQDQLNGAGQSRSQRWYGSMPKPDAAQDQDD